MENRRNMHSIFYTQLKYFPLFVRYLDGGICSESFFISLIFSSCHFVIVIKGNPSKELSREDSRSLFSTLLEFLLWWWRVRDLERKISSKSSFYSMLQFRCLYFTWMWMFYSLNPLYLLLETLKIEDILVLQVLCGGLICLGPLLNVFSSNMIIHLLQSVLFSWRFYFC